MLFARADRWTTRAICATIAQYDVRNGKQAAAMIVRVMRRRAPWVITAVAVIALAALHGPLLAAAAGFLIVNDDIRPVDVIVVPVAADSAGVLEATDLVQRGVAQIVAVSTDPVKKPEAELIRRGAPFESTTDRMIRMLRFAGVTTIERIPSPESSAGTGAEIAVIADWSRQRGLASILVVTTNDHSRRLRRVLRRALRGSAIDFRVRSAGYSEFDPERWWQTRDGLRIGIIELQKLALDLLLHPLS